MNAYDQTATILKALAHPVRLQILELLSVEGEACVCHLEARLKLRQAYISQQLARLREAGLVQDRRDGLNVFYALAAEEIGGCIDGAKRLAASVARAGGSELEFGEIPAVDPARCACPMCEAEPAVASARA